MRKGVLHYLPGSVCSPNGLEIRSGAISRHYAILFLVAPGLFGAQARTQTQNSPLKSLSMEQLRNVKVTAKSKALEQVWKSGAAIFKPIRPVHLISVIRSVTRSSVGKPFASFMFLRFLEACNYFLVILSFF